MHVLIVQDRMQNNVFLAVKNVQTPVIGIAHGIIIGLSRYPLRSLMQDRAHGCECGRVTDDLTPMSHPHNGLHQLH